MGRNKAFDRDEVLERALELFWREGYEATSIATLTRAMGINPPSLYNAFGDKRSLFREAVARYQVTHGAFSGRALNEEPTGRQAVERLLLEAAEVYTDPEHPKGCMIISAGINTTDASVAEELRGYREASKGLIRERIASEVDNAEELAAFFASVIQGMSTQARDGASRTDLESTARLAMLAWPT